MNEVHPIIIPGQHHLAVLLVSHYHEAVKHQVRHLTSKVLSRTAGFWLVGAKRYISSLLHVCVTCRRLREKMEHQQMAALPAEWLQVAPPFTYVGVYVFGPWEVVSRRTRGGVFNSKRWAVMFSCMCSTLKWLKPWVPAVLSTPWGGSLQSGAPWSRSVLTAELISSALLVNWRWTSWIQVSKVWRSTWTLRAAPGYSTRPLRLIWVARGNEWLALHVVFWIACCLSRKGLIFDMKSWPHSWNRNRFSSSPQRCF